MIKEELTLNSVIKCCQTQHGSQCFCGNKAPPENSLRPRRFRKNWVTKAKICPMQSDQMINLFVFLWGCWSFHLLFLICRILHISLYSTVSATPPAQVTEISCVEPFGGWMSMTQVSTEVSLILLTNVYDTGFNRSFFQLRSNLTFLFKLSLRLANGNQHHLCWKFLQFVLGLNFAWERNKQRKNLHFLCSGFSYGRNFYQFLI